MLVVERDRLRLENKRMKDHIKRLEAHEAVCSDPEALWSNWLRGTVKLPSGIGDVRQYQERIKQLEEESESRWKLAESAIGSCAEMSARIQQLEDAIRKTLDENRHLADGDDCTLRELKKVLHTWN